jgi:hypothetical protein
VRVHFTAQNEVLRTELSVSRQALTDRESQLLEQVHRAQLVRESSSLRQCFVRLSSNSMRCVCRVVDESSLQAREQAEARVSELQRKLQTVPGHSTSSVESDLTVVSGALKLVPPPRPVLVLPDMSTPAMDAEESTHTQAIAAVAIERYSILRV